jgi:hypothetical protein
MAQLQSQSYPNDQHYLSAALENAVTVFAKAQSLGDIYIISSAAAIVYVLVMDSADGNHAQSAAGHPSRIYPVEPASAGAFLFRSWHGTGQDFAKGLYVGAYSTLALAIAGGAPDAGAVLEIEANYRRGRIPNAVAADPAGFK